MREETTEMKTYRLLVLIVALLFLSALALPGCFGVSEPKSKVDEAVSLIESSQQMLGDLIDLDERFNSLGTRFSNVEDTIAEGKSLAEMALIDVDELEARYTTARDLLHEVTVMEGAGDYADYAHLALIAVESGLDAIDLNRQLLSTVSDMLDVLPHAENQQQLSYYIEEIDRLTGEISDLLEQGAEAAAKADAYYKEHSL